MCIYCVCVHMPFPSCLIKQCLHIQFGDFMYVCVLVAQSCLTLCNPMDCSQLGSFVHGILQARILEWVAISFSRGFFIYIIYVCIYNIYKIQFHVYSFPDSSVGKESACTAGDLDSIPGLERSPGGGHGNPLQYFCLENIHGQRSLVDYSPWGRRESKTTEQLSTAQHSIICNIWKQNSQLLFIGKINIQCWKNSSNFIFPAKQEAGVLWHRKRRHKISRFKCGLFNY